MTIWKSLKEIRWVECAISEICDLHSEMRVCASLGFFFFSYSSRKTVIEYRLENAAMELRVKGESFGPDSSNLYPLKCAFDLLEKKLEYITTKMN